MHMNGGGLALLGAEVLPARGRPGPRHPLPGPLRAAREGGQTARGRLTPGPGAAESAASTGSRGLRPRARDPARRFQFREPLCASLPDSVAAELALSSL